MRYDINSNGRQETMDDIVITGMGIASPIGCGERAFWEALCAGRSGAGKVVGLDTTGLIRDTACQVQGDMDVGRPIGRAARLAVTAAREAVSGARLDCAACDPDRLHVIIGTTMGETEFIEERLSSEPTDWLCAEHMKRIADGRPGSIAENVSRDLGLSVPACDLYGACAAGNLAMTTARRRLLNGECDVVIAGGADGFSKLAFIGFMRLRVMAAGLCRPFDVERDGLWVGEGAGLFVLERESSARARGAPIRARLIGASITCEDYHPTRPHPDGDGLSRATRLAIADAGLKPSDIPYVCAHGTGTPHNDAIEVKVMQECFPDGVSFSSIKALTGHTMGAAAALEAACCVLTLEHQTLIPTWNLHNLLEPCDLDAVRDAPRSAAVRFAINNSAGFGGYNSSIVLSAA